jgi:hypothetical protein
MASWSVSFVHDVETQVLSCEIRVWLLQRHAQPVDWSQAPRSTLDMQSFHWEEVSKLEREQDSESERKWEEVFDGIGHLGEYGGL